MAELLPCPFCGGEAKYKKFTSKGIFKTTVYYIGCSVCKCQTPVQLHIDEAKDLWNTRTPKEREVSESEM